MEIKGEIFRKYDIRGIYPEEINTKAVYNISRAFADFLKEHYSIEQPKIVLSYDIRKSSEEFSKVAIDALKESGAYVIDIGLTSTPLNYFGNWFLKADGSIIITASHNPKEYNGMKLSLRRVAALTEAVAMEDFKERVLKGDFQDGVGEVIKKDLLSAYIDFLKREAEDFSQFKIAIDCGNGMVGPEIEALAEALKLNYKGIFMEPDGEFPNHEPNPLDEEAVMPLKKIMNKRDFDIGFIFDGDGDRVAILNSRGEVIKSDYIIALFAKYSIEKKESFKIAADARISKGVREKVKEMSGEIIGTKVGYPYVRKVMREGGMFFAGELSCHFFWQDFSYSESTLLSLIRLLKILKEENKPIEELIKPFCRYFSTPEINFKVEDKESVLKEVENYYKEGIISYLDGITIEFEDWWFNLRASGTEPLMRLKVEASNQKLLEEKMKELEEVIGHNT
jgi:phosphomannomutase